ncbi:MAG TPA: MMPL family transporter, partial [Micromonospora sp.]
MTQRAALALIRRRWIVLVVTVVFLALSGVFGGSLEQRLSVGGYTDPATESSKATAALAEKFNTGAPNLILLVADDRGVDDPTVVAAGTKLTERLAAEPGVADVASYWTTRAPSMKADDGKQAVVVSRLTGDDDQIKETLAKLRPDYHGTVDGLNIRFGGSAEVNQELSDQSQQDLARAEAITFPVTLVVLVLVFGSVVAALLPLALA